MKHSLSALAFAVLWWGSGQAEPAPISEIVQHVLQNAPAILQAHADVTAAERELGLFRQSLRMPQLTVSAIPVGLSGTQMQGSATLSLGLNLPTGTTLRLSYTGSFSYTDGATRSTFSGELTQPLSFGLTLITEAAVELDRRQAALEEAKQTLSETQRQVTLDALSSLLDLTIARESIEIAQAQVDLSRRRLEAMHSRVQSGQASQTDLLAAQIELRQNELSLAKLQRDFALNQEKFLATYGLDTTLTWQAPTVKEEIKSLAEVLLHLDVTPEVMAKDARVRRAMQQVAECLVAKLKAQYEALPQVGLTASYDPQGAYWSVGISLRHSFLTDRTLKLEEAQRAFVTAQQALYSTIRTVKLDLLAQRNALHEAYSQLEVLALKDELIALQQVMKEQQRERGLLSESDWEEFLIQKRAFEHERHMALYQLAIAYLRYKSSWGLSFSPKEVFVDE